MQICILYITNGSNITELPAPFPSLDAAKQAAQRYAVGTWPKRLGRCPVLQWTPSTPKAPDARLKRAHAAVLSLVSPSLPQFTIGEWTL